MSVDTSTDISVEMSVDISVEVDVSVNIPSDISVNTSADMSVDMSTDISVEHRSMCRATGDRSVGRDVDRHIGQGVRKLHMIQNKFS